MEEKNNRENTAENKGKDLFEDFKRENSDIDELLDDAFSFMEETYEEEEPATGAQTESFNEDEHVEKYVPKSSKKRKEKPQSRGRESLVLA